MNAVCGGPQWVLLTCFLIVTFAPPLVRVGLIQNGHVLKKSWPDFWGGWFSDLTGRLFVVCILIWGGFWG